MLKCLVVDDDELERNLIIQYLTGLANCDMAANGREAFKKFSCALDAGAPYDLIMLDLLMPEMDGYETGKAIRSLEAERGIPVISGVNIIVVSCVKTPQEIIQAYISSQSVAQLHKPVNPEKLRKILIQSGIDTSCALS